MSVYMWFFVCVCADQLVDLIYFDWSAANLT